MATHTPGPWRLLPAGIDECHETHCFDYVEVAPKRYIRCEGRTNEEANANAHLIAAAPDLYEALNRLVKTLDEATGRKCPEIAEQPTSPMGQARTALAKAEGR